MLALPQRLTEQTEQSQSNEMNQGETLGAKKAEQRETHTNVTSKGWINTEMRNIDETKEKGKHKKSRI